MARPQTSRSLVGRNPDSDANTHCLTDANRDPHSYSASKSNTDTYSETYARSEARPTPAPRPSITLWENRRPKRRKREHGGASGVELAYEQLSMPAYQETEGAHGGETTPRYLMRVNARTAGAAKNLSAVVRPQIRMSRQSDSNRRPADYKPREEAGVCYNSEGDYGVRHPFATFNIRRNSAIMAVFGSKRIVTCPENVTT